MRPLVFLGSNDPQRWGVWVARAERVGEPVDADLDGDLPVSVPVFVVYFGGVGAGGSGWAAVT